MKLLVVEDDAKIAGALRRGLSAEGFAVEVAGDGTEGLWRAREAGYDLIVLDILLPGRNGYQLCEDLRRAGDRTPILMLTALDGELDEAEGLDLGADDYLRKPFSFPVLVARIHALLRRAALGEPPPVEIGNLRLEARNRRVRRGTVEIRLTSREFDLLTFLIRHAGQVVSKQQILAGVWQDDFDGDPNVVEVYIRRLRRKIDDPFGHRTIETLRGAGYRVCRP
jgi:two-component system OmpR family response regulator